MTRGLCPFGGPSRHARGRSPDCACVACSPGCLSGFRGLRLRRPHPGGRGSLLHGCFDCTAPARYFLRARIQVTSSLMSFWGTWAFGGMGIWPHTPEPPSLTFFSSAAWAFLSARYLAATSTYAGPTIFLSTAWQAAQPSFFINASAWALSSAAWAGAATSAAAASVRNASFMVRSILREKPRVYRTAPSIPATTDSSDIIGGRQVAPWHTYAA